MFKVNDNAITPRRRLFENALTALPASHVAARQAAMNHLHAAVAADVEEAGLSAAPLTVGIDRSGYPRLGIAAGEEGDRLADIEYGDGQEAANPVIRGSIYRHHDEARQVFENALYEGLGF